MTSFMLPDNMREMDVVTSGSSSKFPAHIGFWMALRHLGIRPVRVATNSGGTLVNALRESGYDLEEIAEIVKETDFRDYISTGYRALLRAVSKGYLSTGEKYLGLLEELIGPRRLKDIETPTYIMGSDITRGQLVIFTQETHPNMSLALATYISSCMPLAFQPVVLTERVERVDKNGERYFEDMEISYRDGGLYKDFPIDIWKDTPRWRVGHLVGKAKYIQHKSWWTGRDEAFMLGDRAVDANVDASLEHIPDMARTVIVESDGFNLSSLNFDIDPATKQALQEQGFVNTLAALKPFAEEA